MSDFYDFSCGWGQCEWCALKEEEIEREAFWQDNLKIIRALEKPNWIDEI